MKIFVKAKPNSAHPKLEKTGPVDFTIAVSESPVGGKANEAITEVLAEYFDVPKSAIKLLRGFNGRNKVFEV